MPYAFHLVNLDADIMCETKSYSPADHYSFQAPDSGCEPASGSTLASGSRPVSDSTLASSSTLVSGSRPASGSTLASGSRPASGSTLASGSRPASSPTKSFHNHDGYELLLLLDGRLNFFTEGDGKELEAGDLICIRPYEFHRAELQSPNLYNRIVINIRETLLPSLCSPQSDLSGCFYRNPSIKINFAHLGEQEVHDFIHMAKQLSLVLTQNEFGSDLLARAWLQQILVLINRHTMNQEPIRHQSIMPPLISQLFSYIDDHLADDLTLDSLSRQFHHNGTYLSRRFCRITGISLQQYIIEKRIALAQKYLREGHAPCDVCYMTGFNNYSNFSRTFSQKTGVSPKQYQMNYQNPAFMPPSSAASAD